MFGWSCKGSTSGLSQQSREAEGSPTLEAQGRVGAALTTVGRAGTARRPSAHSARRRGTTKVNQWLNPLKRCAGSNLVDMGRDAVHVGGAVRRRGLRSRINMPGGEAMPNGCGVGMAMLQGEELGVHPVDRHGVNVGTIIRPPRLGQARCRLRVWLWDGGSVVVRGRESRPHGEGTQRASSSDRGMPGGRW